MPELPEVESIRLDLVPSLEGQILTKLELVRTDILRLWPEDLPTTTLDLRTLEAIKRHGKYLLFHFSGAYTLLIHLRMTGKLIYLPALPEEEQEALLHAKHTHALLHFTSGTLLFNDVRRFGRLTILKDSELATLPGGFNTMGPDALDSSFTWETLRTFAQAHPKMPVKSLLMDQRAVAGIGNIYADEALFHGAVRPMRPASSITDAEWQLLTSEMKRILLDATLQGGTSFRDYRKADNQMGQYASKLFVYGRAGEPCYTCGEQLASVVIGGRRSVYCPHCQL